MGLYNFQPQFVPLILDGTKQYTIRGRRKVEDGVGDLMYLYVHLRTPKCRRIAVVPCTRVGLVEIPNRTVFRINGVTLSDNSLRRLATMDGFTNVGELMRFFEHRFPFEGKIYHWNPLR